MGKLKIKYLLITINMMPIMKFIKMVDILFDKMNIKGKLSEGGMKAVIDYIERNLKKGISLEDVANHVNISTYYLSKIFKKEMGVNFNHLCHRPENGPGKRDAGQHRYSGA